MPTTPPGPQWPTSVQTLAWWSRPLPFFERARARYGKRFTIRLLDTPPMVNLSDPAEVKEVFTAAPEVLHPGEGARILEPIVGPNSVILLDEDPHLEQRRLMLPAFKGERMERLTGLVSEVAEREIAAWPRDVPVALHRRLQALTLEIILRAVFGLDPGPRLDGLRDRLTRIIEFGATPFGLVKSVQRDLGPGSPGRRFAVLKAEIDGMLRELVDERRASAQERDDVLAMLVDARHEDGSPMSFDEIRDELMTALVAGHETTASQLAWTLALLVRAPGVVRELVRELDGGDGDDYLTAVLNESMRRRPVLPTAEPRLTKRTYATEAWTYPEGVVLAANAYLLHHDATIYPEPYAFRPERFLDEPPTTYTLIPFGGGRRRCIGASFAVLEMKVVLRVLLARDELRPAGGGRLELARRRSISISPSDGARVLLRPRADAEADGATAPAASTASV